MVRTKMRRTKKAGRIKAEDFRNLVEVRFTREVSHKDEWLTPIIASSR
mgnify:CR=1 FL=1